MPCIQIYDHAGGFLSFDLRDILASLESIGPSLNWYLLALEARSRPESRLAVLDLEQEISSTSCGKSIGWADLTGLAGELAQTSNCVIVGVRPGEDPPRLPLKDTDRENKVIIVAFDSSYWTVCAPETEVIGKLQDAFRETKLVERVDTA